MASWKECIMVGESFEDFIIKEICEKLGYNIQKNIIPSEYKYYDFTILNNGITVECKFDIKANESKNICIETHNDDNKSGILVTTADFWIIGDGFKGFIISAKDIKRCIYEGYISLYPEEPTKFLYMKRYPIRQENNRTKLMNFYTIPTWLFEKYCIEVNEINKLTYRCIG